MDLFSTSLLSLNINKALNYSIILVSYSTKKNFKIFSITIVFFAELDSNSLVDLVCFVSLVWSVNHVLYRHNRQSSPTSHDLA